LNWRNFIDLLYVLDRVSNFRDNGLPNFAGIEEEKRLLVDFQPETLIGTLSPLVQ